MSVLVAGTDTPAGQAAYRFGIEEARRRGEDLVVFLMSGTHTPSPELGEDVRVLLQLERKVAVAR